jgi:hypothetical protein
MMAFKARCFFRAGKGSAPSLTGSISSRPHPAGSVVGLRSEDDSESLSFQTGKGRCAGSTAGNGKPRVFDLAMLTSSE